MAAGRFRHVGERVRAHQIGAPPRCRTDEKLFVSPKGRTSPAEIIAQNRSPQHPAWGDWRPLQTAWSKTESERTVAEALPAPPKTAPFRAPPQPRTNQHAQPRSQTARNSRLSSPLPPHKRAALVNPPAPSSTFSHLAVSSGRASHPPRPPISIVDSLIPILES